MRNGDIWTVTAVGDEGTITIARDYATGTTIRDDGTIRARRRGRRLGGSIVLPASYVAEHVDLGYAVTAYRAQGVTIDTAHVLVEPTLMRETFQVAMTRGRHSNHAYVTLDRADDHAQPHPGDDPHATARSVLYGVLQHSGAELSAHETIVAEQEQWGSIAQLAAEYETIAAAAQHDRWVTLVRCSGLAAEQAESASVIHHLANATARPADSGRTRHAPRLIVGLIPEATGPMTPDMQQALTERRQLIETRVAAVLDTVLHTHESWTTALGPIPADGRERQQWRRRALVVAAYRDRYQITDPTPLGAKPEGTAQKPGPALHLSERGTSLAGVAPVRSVRSCAEN